MRRRLRTLAARAAATFPGTAAVLALAAVATACGDRGGPPARAIALAECRLPRLAVAAQCGEWEVPEDRSRPEGRRIKLVVAVLPANTLNPRADPLFILAGGPGQAATRLGPFAAQLVDVRRNRDIVLVDQRGTGRSSPLDCVAFRPSEGPDAAIDVDPLPKARGCLAQLAARGVDPTQYTTAAFVADLDAVRAALGYERINLWGGSYGSRAALEYLRAHPAYVRSMVLDGVVPPGMVPLVDVWPTREAAFAGVLAACANSPACDAAHLNLEAALATIGESLGATGREVAFTDPRTGETRTLQLDFDQVLAALQGLLYVPELASLLPEVIDAARDGNFAPLFAARSLLGADLAEQVDPALHFAVTCADDAPRLTPARIEQALAGARTRAVAERALGVCAVWPRGTAPATPATAVTSDVPVLMLSGGLDPVTPPAYGAEVGRTLPNSRHVVAAGYGHIVSPHACAPRLIGAFIDDPGAAKLPATCVAHFESSARPPLWPDRLGGQP